MKICVSNKSLHLHALNRSIDPTNTSSPPSLNSITWELQLRRHREAEQIRDDSITINENSSQENEQVVKRKRKHLAQKNRLKDVEIMSLSFNALETLDWLTPSMFPHLRVLDVSHNGLKSLNGLESVSTTLEILRCNNNALTALPSAASWSRAPFIRLKELWLSRNKLENVLDLIATLSTTCSFLQTLVVYQNNLTKNVLSDIQIKHLLVAKLGNTLKVLDGTAVTPLDVEQSLKYWKTDLGKQMLSVLKPKAITLLEKKAVLKEQSQSQQSQQKQGVGLGYHDKPWRKHMKKKIKYELPRQRTKMHDRTPTRPEMSDNNNQHSSIPPSPRRHQISTHEALNDEAPTSIENKEEDELYQMALQEGARMASQLRDSMDDYPNDLPLPGAYVEDQVPTDTTTGNTDTTDNTNGANSNGSNNGRNSGTSSILDAMSMLPDLSSRLGKVGGGSFQIKQNTRRMAVANGMTYIDPSVLKKKKKKEEEKKRKMKLKKKNKNSILPRVTQFGGPLPNSELTGNEKSIMKSTKTRITTTDLNQQKKIRTKNNQQKEKHLEQEDNPLALARLLIEKTQKAAAELSQRHTTTTTTTDSSNDIVLSSPRPDVNDSTALNAARRLAAAATAAAQSMSEATQSIANGTTSHGVSEKSSLRNGTSNSTNGSSGLTADSLLAQTRKRMKRNQIPTEAKRMYTSVRGRPSTIGTIIRKDGSAQARWPNGSGLAISIDREDSPMNENMETENSRGSIGWRTFVSKAPGGTQMALSLDPNGYGSINRCLTGKTLISFNGYKKGGSLLSRDGMCLKKWDGNGNVTLPDGTPTSIGNNGSTTLKIKLEEKGKLIASLTIDSKLTTQSSFMKLVIFFKCRNILQRFIHGQNEMPIQTDTKEKE